VKNPKSAVKVYCKATYGFNTHSLRYAYITYLLSKGVNPSLVAKITGHRNLSYILHYTELKTAEDILLKLK
jgi:site-specific recombinase XerD